MASQTIPAAEFVGAGAIGAATAYLLTKMSPLSGFWFGGTMHLIRILVSEGLSFLGDSVAARTFRFAVSMLAGALVAFGACNLLGLTVSLGQAEVIVASLTIIAGLSADILNRQGQPMARYLRA
ncbi:MAG: hypothetical protein ACHQT8_01605 [Chlamydiales bacterium]